MAKYMIRYTGVFEKGYVQLTLYRKDNNIHFDCETTIKTWATKFRFKCIANFICYILNKTDKEFRTFKIIQYNNLKTK